MSHRLPVEDGALAFDLIQPRAGGPRAPLIFLHGWTLDRRMWALQADAFPERPVVLLDRRGCGESSAPFDLAAEADDVLALADHLGFGTFVIVGMSQAGQIAADLAVSHPSRVAGLVFHGARLGPIAAGSQPDIPLDTYRALARSGDIAALKTLWRAHPLMRLSDPDRQADVDAMLERYDGADLLAGQPARPVAGWDAFERLGIPALVLTGRDETPLRRSVADQLAGTLPRATRVEIEGGGHMCNLCAPAAYNEAVRCFLETL